MAKIDWIKIKDQSLAVAVRKVGFDLSIFDEYSKSTQKEIQKLASAKSMARLREEFRSISGRELKSVTRGVYAICLADPFVFNYENGHSEIIYIGQGNVFSRLKGHYERSLFDLMQNLSGVNFDFYLCEPKRPGGGRANDYYKHIEFLLLNRFRETIGGKKHPFPLLNKNAGSDKKLAEPKGWDLPLSRKGKRPKWRLEPTNWSAYRPLD